MAIRTLAFLTSVTLFQVALFQAAARTTDWQYCLALSYGEHVAYFSAPFPVSGNVSRSEIAFRAALSDSGSRFDIVQCPRADSQAQIAHMRAHAIDFNQQEGNRILRIGWPN
jgi:hypothetical protein